MGSGTLTTAPANFPLEITYPAATGASVAGIRRDITVKGTCPAGTQSLEYRVDDGAFAEITNRSYRYSGRWSQDIRLTGGTGIHTVTVRGSDSGSSIGTVSFSMELQAPNIYYIDFDNGNDANSGTSASSAWRHCPDDQNAAGISGDHAPAAGDVFIFKGGVRYRGYIANENSGESYLRPIVYDGDTGMFAAQWGTGKAVLDGSEPLTGTWNPATSGDLPACPDVSRIYWIRAPDDYTEFSQSLYENDRFLWWCQYPRPSDRMDFDSPEDYRQITAGNLTRTSCTDPSVFSQGTSASWTEAWIFVYHEGNNSFYKQVTGVTGGSTAHFEDIVAGVGTYNGYNVYAVANHPSVMTEAGETYYESATRRIYIWPRDSDNPNTSGKVYTYGTRNACVNTYGSNIIIQGFTMQKAFGAVNGFNDGIAVRGINSSHPASDVYFLDNEITNMRSMDGSGLVTLTLTHDLTAADSVIRNNRIHDNQKNRGMNIDGANITASYNTIENNNSTAMLFFPVINSQLHHNTIRNMKGTHTNSITVYGDSSDVLVAHNYIYNAPRPFTSGAGGTALNLTLFGNSFDGGTDDDQIADWGENGGYYRAINNTVTSRGTGNQILTTSTGTQFLYINNIIGGGSLLGTHEYNIYTSLSWDQTAYHGWTAGTGELVDYVDRETEIYADYDNSDGSVDLNLRPGSPATESGTDITGYLPIATFPYYDFTVDINGNPLARDGVWNIGAYGYAN